MIGDLTSVSVLVEREGFDSPNATPINRPFYSKPEGNDGRPKETSSSARGKIR